MTSPRPWTDEEHAEFLRLRATTPPTPFRIVAQLIGRSLGSCIRHQHPPGQPYKPKPRNFTVPREKKVRVREPKKPVWKAKSKKRAARPLALLPKVELPDAPPEPPEALHLPLDQLNREMCHWPLESGAYCGAKRERRSYCRYHAHVAFKPLRPLTKVRPLRVRAFS